MSEQLKGEVISGIRSCLVSVKGRCDLRQINNDFLTLMGYKIPFAQMGHKNLEQFILSIPTLSTSYINGQLLVDAKPTEKSGHMVNLVQKQQAAKKKSRYASRSSGNRYAHRPPTASRWQSSGVNRNFKKPYQSSPRPKAVAHNQFVNLPSPSKSKSDAVSSTSTRLAGIRELKQSTSVEEPVKKEQDVAASSLSSRAKKRITQKMADITIDSSIHSSSDCIWTSTMNFNATQDSPISGEDILRLHQESLTACDLQNPVWNFSSGSSNSSLANGKEDDRLKLSPMELTGDYVADLLAFTKRYKLEEPCITIKTRKTKAQVEFYCSIKVETDTFSSYPKECYDELSAKQAAAEIALKSLMPKYNKKKSLLVSDTKDVLNRIPPMVKSHFSGLWNTQLEADYVEIYNEQLPMNWVEIIDTDPYISVLRVIGKRYVLRYCKRGEVFQKGGNFTPPSICHVSVPSNTVRFDDAGYLLAEITCVASAGEIWCRQMDTPESNDFSKVMVQFEKFYSNQGNAQQIENVEVGGYYVGYFDEMWSRVRVFEVDGNSISCFCIDYGDEWLLQKPDLYQLDRHFALVQAQAFVCRLAGVEELYEASASSEYLNSLIGKDVQVLLDSNEDEGRVSPRDPAIPVILLDIESGVVINEQLVTSISIESALPVLDKASPTEVYLTHALDDGSVYLQVRSTGYNQLNMLLDQLAKDVVENKHKLPKVTINEDSKEQLFFTQSQSDNVWYRAKIIQLRSDFMHAQILFIDTGKTEMRQVNTKPIYPLNELSDIIGLYPSQALHVKLSTSSKFPNFVKKITELIPAHQSVLAKLISDDALSLPVVDLFKRSETDNVLFSINTALLAETEFNKKTHEDPYTMGTKPQSTKLQRLISLNQFDGTTKNVPSSGCLSCPPLPEIGKYLDIKIPCAVNPYNFFVQPYESHEKLKKLMAALQERYSIPQYSPLQIEDVQPGKIYASKHEDGAWYRTNVLKVIHQGSISAFYCDFGFYTTLNLKQLLPLDNEFMDLPYQAIKAKIANIKPQHSKWSMDDCKYFEHLVCKKSFVSILVAKEMDDLYRSDTLLSLKLIDTSTNVDIYIDKLLVDKGIARYDS